MIDYLTFDDVLLTPAYSTIDSRDEISTHSKILPNLILSVPVISSPMSSVTEVHMAKAMALGGGLGVLHRFADPASQLHWINELENTGVKFAVSTGLREKFVGLWNTDIVNIDTAHGDRKEVLDLITYIKLLYRNVKVIAGNVATASGYDRLASAGADAVRVGIGPGAACTTRIVCGVGVPQFSAIQQIYERKKAFGPNAPTIIADGGIRNSGDMIKALAAGADAVMLGKVLAHCEEASGESHFDGHNTFRKYAGQSTFGNNSDKQAKEGEVGWVEVNTTVADVLKSWGNYLRSGMSYLGARNLSQLRENAHFIRVTQASLQESNTRL